MARPRKNATYPLINVALSFILLLVEITKIAAKLMEPAIMILMYAKVVMITMGCAVRMALFHVLTQSLLRVPQVMCFLLVVILHLPLHTNVILRKVKCRSASVVQRNRIGIRNRFLLSHTSALKKSTLGEHSA
jgi:hypothetical protein